MNHKHTGVEPGSVWTEQEIEEATQLTDADKRNSEAIHRIEWDCFVEAVKHKGAHKFHRLNKQMAEHLENQRKGG